MTRSISYIYVAMGAALIGALSGCADPVAVQAVAASTHIIASADSVGFDRTLLLSATSLDATGDTLAGDRVTWTSSDNGVLTIDADGVVRGVRPGKAYARAQDGSAQDSVLLTVVTSFCDSRLSISATGNAFTGAFTGPGTLSLDDPLMDSYHNIVSMTIGAGVVFGNDVSTAAMAFNDAWFPGADLMSGGVCTADDAAPVHTVSVVHALDVVPSDPTPMVPIPGLMIVQDAYAFTNAEDDDNLLYKYTFTNYGTSAIEHFTFGMFFNFDLYTLFQDVGSLDADGTATVIALDSVNHPAVAGVAVLNANVGTYFTHFDPGTTVHRAQFYTYLTSGIGPVRTPAQDVRQMLTAEPFDIPARSTKIIWIAFVAGGDRAAFDASLAAARARMAILR